MLTLDHLAVSASDLAEGVTRLQDHLGAPFAGGGQHDLMSTHNRLLGLGETYLEVIAINPDAPDPGRARWFDLDRFSGPPRLTNWVARCADLEAALALCPPGMGPPLQMQRGDYRWRMAVPLDGILPFDGCFPALIEWQGASHPAQALPDSGLRLTQVILTHPASEDLALALGRVIDDPRITVENGPVAGLKARFDGPSGTVWLT